MCPKSWDRFQYHVIPTFFMPQFHKVNNSTCYRFPKWLKDFRLPDIFRYKFLHANKPLSTITINTQLSQYQMNMVAIQSIGSLQFLKPILHKLNLMTVHYLARIFHNGWGTCSPWMGRSGHESVNYINHWSMTYLSRSSDPIHAWWIHPTLWWNSQQPVECLVEIGSLCLTQTLPSVWNNWNSISLDHYASLPGSNYWYH